MKKEIPILIYFMNEWWSKHFYNTHRRPEKPADDELVRVYLERKKFLFENLGEFGFGEEKPVLDGKYLNCVMKWGMDIIPYILGAKLQCMDIGAYYVNIMDEDQIKNLKPVNIANHPLAEWILKRKEELIGRYGSAELGKSIEASVNIASRIRGNEFYIDLLLNKGFAKHLLDVLTQTAVMLYEFYAKEFKLKNLMLANCTINHISPETYEEMCLPFDLHLVKETEGLFDKEKYVNIHHCDASVDKYLDKYEKIPKVYRLEASYKSDIRKATEKMPGVSFCAFINPADMINKTPEQFGQIVSSTLKSGAGELILWNIDPAIGIEKLVETFRMLEKCCQEQQINPVYNVLPLSLDEIEWAFPRYKGYGTYQCL